MKYLYFILFNTILLMHPVAYAEEIKVEYKSYGTLMSTNTQTGEVIIADKDNGKKLYQNSCRYCHKTDGKKSLVGALNLQGISTRRSDVWLSDWLKSPVAFAKVNAEAKKLLDENPILIMPSLPEMQETQKRLDIMEYMKTL
ncbi:MAG: cytochrome c [Mariprofundaceae bacterium]|nr:cytochrome c [Mariprofundaceae bacterium]